MRTPERRLAGASAADRPAGAGAGRQAWQAAAAGPQGAASATGQRQPATGQQGAAWPTAGQQGAPGGAAAGRSPSARLRIASGGPQQGRRGHSAGRALRASQGLLGAAAVGRQ